MVSCALRSCSSSKRMDKKELTGVTFHRLTINSAHPTTQKYYKSSSARKNEETRHLMNYRRTIHPFSLINLFWEYFMACVYLYMFIIYFLSTLFIYEDYLSLYHIRRGIGDCFYVLDLIHYFFEGYYDHLKHRSVLNRGKIAKKYLTTYFIIDVIALLPNLSLVLYAFTRRPETMYMRFFGLIRILRIKRLLDAFKLFKNYKDYSSYHFRAIRAILIYVVIVLFLYSLMFIVNHHIELFTTNNVKHDGALDFLSATLILFLVSQGLEPLHNHYIILTVTVSLFCGFFIHLFLHAQVLQVWNKFFSARSRNEDLLQQFKEYISYRGLPLEINEKIMLYFNFKFQNNFYNEMHISYLVSNTLREEIMANIAHNYLVKADILKDIPRSTLVKIVSKLRSEIFLPDDIIVVAGKPASSMYFVYYGTLAVYGADGVEVAHIEDGDCFGEMDMLFHEVRKHSIVAITPCELFNLNKTDFFEALVKRPDLKKRILDKAMERLLSNTRVSQL